MQEYRDLIFQIMLLRKKKNKRRAAPKDRRIRPVRKGQRGRGFFSSFKKIDKNSLVRQIGKTALKKAVNYVPQLSNLGTSKIKNRTARNILQSDATTNILNNLVTKYGNM